MWQSVIIVAASYGRYSNVVLKRGVTFLSSGRLAFPKKLGFPRAHRRFASVPRDRSSRLWPGLYQNASSPTRRGPSWSERELTGSVWRGGPAIRRVSLSLDGRERPSSRVRGSVPPDHRTC